MKPLIVNIVILLSVITAGYLFTIKFKEPTNIDKVRNGLKGIDRYLSYNTHLGFICAVDDGELPPAVNYALTPILVDMLNAPKLDTTLIILPIDKKESDIIGKSSILWQNKDDAYKYILITKTY